MVPLNSAACNLVTIFLAFLVIQRLDFASGTNYTSYSNITSCFKSERNALLEFKHSLNDVSNILSSWIGDECCMWAGIRCSRQTGHVVKLDLRINNKIHNFGGELSNSLRYLKHLTYLDLSMNYFGTIKIPGFLGSLMNLQYLNLSYSSFTGEVPHHLGNLTNLQYLDLSNNFMLNIDSLWWVSQLYSLKFLDLSDVELSKATNWLPAISLLPSLSVLNLGGCFLNIPLHSNINSTSLGSLDLSNNYQANMTTVPHWLSNITGLVKLNLHFNYYNGPLPESFERLRSLTFLDLSQNSFTTFLPTTLSKLRNLLHLDLSNNEFVGPIPFEMSNLTQLTYLDLSSNKLTGNLPPSFEKLAVLESLIISSNRLSGTIPSFIGQLSKLERIKMGGNSMTGIISEIYFHNLISLAYLDLSSNSGVVTNFSSMWTPPFQLKILDLSYCKVGPKFPWWLRNQRNLKYLLLRNASIADNIPHWFSSLNVQILDLSRNKITGNPVLIHSNLLALDVSSNLISRLLVSNASNSLGMLYAADNLFTGTFPTWLCNMTSSVEIDLSYNQLSGRLPSCLGSIDALVRLDLTYNSFSGNVPECLGSLTFLESLHLHNNKFEGHLPSSFQNLSRLFTLDVGENAITGIIPPWIGATLSKLMILNLQSNSFHGPIPQQICQLSYLQILNLAKNNISGSVPSCFNNLSAMTGDQFPAKHYPSDTILENFQSVERLYQADYVISIDLSNNNIIGVIPKEVLELLSLLKLSLSGNHIEGPIPDQIGNLRQLQYLDLSRNKLSGSIPQSLSNLSFLTNLNLSFNDLSGKIPTGQQLQTLSDPSIYMGNERLCGAPLNECNREHDSSDHTSNEEPDNNEDDSIVDVWFYSGMGPGFSVVFLGFCGSLHYNKRWRYAYYRFLENVYNTLAVAIAVKTIQLRRKFQKQETEG